MQIKRCTQRETDRYILAENLTAQWRQHVNRLGPLYEKRALEEATGMLMKRIISKISRNLFSLRTNA